MQNNETDDTLISSVDHAFLTILIKVYKLYYLTTNNETYKSKVLSYQGGRFNLQEVYSLINTLLNNLLQNKETTKNDDSILSTDEKDITSKNNNLGVQNLTHTCPKKIMLTKIPNPKQKGLRSTSAINKTQKQPKQPPEQDYKKSNLFKSYMPKKGDTDEYIYAVLQGNSEQKDKILEPIISINQINYSNDINVIAELSSTTLITGSDKGIISALRLDYKTRKFSIFCQKKKAHDDTITSFGVLNKTNILSSSCDTTIKQWEFDFQQFKEIHVYKGHTDYVRKILILDTNIFASCSRDGNIYIWNSNKGRTVANLQEQGDICSIIQLQHSKLIVSSCLTQRSISFWNYGLQQQMYRMKNIYTFSPNGMIQLENQNIAIASYDSPYNLKIVDPLRYAVIYEISNPCMTSNVTLTIRDKGKFFYFSGKMLLEISENNYEILAQHTMKASKGEGLLWTSNKNYLLMPNNNRGINVVQFTNYINI